MTTQHLTSTLVTTLLLLLQVIAAQVSTPNNLPVVKMTVPRCMSIVLDPSEYVLTDDGRLHLAADIGGTVVEPGHFDVSATDRTAHVCYPLSDELRNCHHKVALQHFRILPSRAVTDVLLDRRWPLGHFYLTDKGRAVVCSAGDAEIAVNSKVSTSNSVGGDNSNGVTRVRRACSYLTLQPAEYRVNARDNTLLIVPANNRSVADASYTIDPLTLSANVCVPLSPGLLNCSAWVLERNEVELLPNKSLRSLPHERVYELGDYVLLSEGRAAVCALEILQPDPMNADLELLHAAVNIISAVFLAAAIVVHLLLPELSYQRAPILCHAFSFMITYLCLASRRLVPSLEPTDCYVIFYITYYFAVASFCWLSVLAFDVWRITVHLSTGTTGYPWVNHFASRRFLSYAAFGWGFPVLAAVLLTVVDRHELVQDSLQLFPRLEMMCWFNDQHSAFAFLYGPMCFMLVFNFLTFGLSVRNIQRANTQVEFTNKKLNKQLLVICFVVFMAMGLFWIMELVSFSTHIYGINWLVPDLVNGLQGVVISVVYTVRPLTWRLLREKFCTKIALKQ